MKEIMITIADVAREAGVSVATVSRVLNKNGPVSPAAHEKVALAIAKLNYQRGQEREQRGRAELSHGERRDLEQSLQAGDQQHGGQQRDTRSKGAQARLVGQQAETEERQTAAAVKAVEQPRQRQGGKRHGTGRSFASRGQPRMIGGHRTDRYQRPLEKNLEDEPLRQNSFLRVSGFFRQQARLRLLHSDGDGRKGVCHQVDKQQMHRRKRSWQCH